MHNKFYNITVKVTTQQFFAEGLHVLEYAVMTKIPPPPPPSVIPVPSPQHQLVINIEHVCETFRYIPEPKKAMSETKKKKTKKKEKSDENV